MARFGRKSKRSGGRALDYYSSQVFWLNEEDRIEKKGIIQGISVEAFVSKNKVGKPFRKVKFDILFEHGIDSYGSVIDFLCSNKVLERSKNGFIKWTNEKSYYKENLIQHFEENPKEFEKATKLAQETWNNIEEESSLKRKKKYP
jgi:recombination protein RecA